MSHAFLQYVVLAATVIKNWFPSTIDEKLLSISVAGLLAGSAAAQRIADAVRREWPQPRNSALRMWSEASDSAAVRRGGRSMALRTIGVMKFVRNVIVFDAADLTAESAFWAGILGGHIFADEAWHSVIDAAGEWRIGVQLAPNHVPPPTSCARGGNRTRRPTAPARA